MKKLIVLLILLLSLLIAAGCNIGTNNDNDKTKSPETTSTEPPADDTKDYVSEEYGFRTKYAKDWTVSNEIENVLVTFVCPDRKDFASNVNIMVFPGAAGVSDLEEFSELAKQDLESSIADYEELEYDDIETSAWKGKYIIFSGSYDTLELKWAQVWFIHDGDAYLITYVSDLARFDKYLDDAKIIAENLVIED